MKLKIFFFCVLLAQLSVAQEYTLAPEDSYELAIDGTSTLHGWTAKASDITGVPESISVTDGVLAITPMSIVTQVMSLDGGRGPAMNSKIQKALKVDTNPEVIFAIEKQVQIELGSLTDEGVPITGALTVAGKTQEVELITQVKVEDDKLLITGSRDMKMSSFDIEAPSAMFGQIKTNDDITIRFSVHYSSK